jgi:hypothetical protein
MNVKNIFLLRDRLRELRGANSQVVTAKAFSVAQPTYAGWEVGRSKPDAIEICAIACHYGVSTDYLLGLSDERNPPRAGSASTGNGASVNGGSIVSAVSGGTVHIQNGGADAAASAEQLAALIIEFRAQAAALQKQISALGGKTDFVADTVNKVVVPRYAELDVSNLAARVDELEQNALRMQNRSERRRECAYKGDIEELKRRLPDAQNDATEKP